MPQPEPLSRLEPSRAETRRMHALADYGLMHVKLYEDISRHGHIAPPYAYPVEVAGRYVMDPSPPAVEVLDDFEPPHAASSAFSENAPAPSAPPRTMRSLRKLGVEIGRAHV